MKKTHIIGILVIAVAIATITVSIGDSSQYVSFDKAEAYPDHQYHVVGQLVEDKPLTYNPQEDPNYFTFYLEDDKGNTRKVVYHDAKPQDFERSDQVVVVGSMKGENTFQADKILMKCPSKYNEEGIKMQSNEKTEVVQ